MQFGYDQNVCEMTILAGVVVYMPEYNRLRENITRVLEQVDKLVIVINGIDSYEITKKCSKGHANIEFIVNNNNMGIAFALKQIMEFAMTNDIDWVLSLDQDSVIQPGLINEYRNYIHLKKIGILTCNIKDRNFYEANGFKNNEDVREVDKCITAASLMSVEAYKSCSGYDENMFIDGVDWDICFNLRRNGYSVYKINFDGLLQEVGKAKNVKLFKKNYVTYGHSPFRNYYQAKNNIFIAKKYPEYYTLTKAILVEWRTALLILLYEDKKFAKLIKRTKGFLEGVLRR